MAETVHVAIYDTLADWEVGAAIAHINDPQWQKRPGRYRVQTVALTADPIVTMAGMRIVPDTTLDQVAPSESAMLILPGATAWDTSDMLTPFAKKARELLDADVPVAAICGATGGLAKEGLLDDRDHTSGAAVYLDSLGYGGAARYKDVPAVTDRNVITAGPPSPFEFAREIFAALDMYSPEVLAAWYQLFGQNDPAGYYVLASA